MARTIASLNALGRLAEPGLLILASLCTGKKHGYALILDIEAHTAKRMGPGTLYGALARLEGLGFVEPLSVGDRGRRPYRITHAGRRAFAERLSELQAYRTMLLGLAAR